MSSPPETALYEPVKRFLVERGYEVKAEVGDADVVGLQEGEEPVIVELKRTFTLGLLRQAVARLAITDSVYVAVPRWRGRSGWRTFKGNVGLCRRLGVGVLSVRTEDGTVQVHAEPGPFRTRKSRVRRTRMLKEFTGREGDPNLGGTRGKVVTAYRQRALRCASYLLDHGPSRGAEVAKATGVAQATRIMRDNHYGWFENVSRGVYTLSDDAPTGGAAPHG